MMARKLVVEAIGTFFLVFTVGMVVTASSPPPLAALAVGAVLMVMVFAGGHISGAHYNPAVTLAIFLRGRASSRDLMGYWVSQLIAGLLAGALARFFAEVAATPDNLDFLLAGLAEFIFSFGLAYVVLNTATTRGTEGNSYYGLAIGFTVFAGAVAVGPVSGAVFNPAVALGLLTLGAITPNAFLLYVAATLAGAATAALVFKALDMGNDKPTTATPAEQGKLKQAGSTRG